MLIAAALVGSRPHVADLRPVTVLLALALALSLVQLTPLPPALWEKLPGRQMFIDAGRLSGEATPWRPWTIVPGATLNARLRW